MDNNGLLTIKEISSMYGYTASGIRYRIKKMGMKPTQESHDHPGANPTQRFTKEQAEKIASSMKSAPYKNKNYVAKEMKQKEKSPQLIKLGDAQEVLEVERDTMMGLVKSRNLQTYKLDKVVFLNESEIYDLAEELKKKAESERKNDKSLEEVKLKLDAIFQKVDKFADQISDDLTAIRDGLIGGK